MDGVVQREWVELTMNQPSRDPVITARVISMATAVERRQRMSEQLDSLPIAWEFFDAHTGPAPELVLHEKSWQRINGRMLNAAEIGCYSSHYTLWREHAKAPVDDIMMVFEDDGLLDTDYLADLGPLREIVGRYGFVRFHCHLIAPAQTLLAQGRRRVLRFKRPVHGTLAYCLDGRTARRLTERLRPLYRPVDVEMDRYWQHGIPITCLYPFVALERAAPTQIGERGFQRGSAVDHVHWKVRNQVEKLRRWNVELRYRMPWAKAAWERPSDG